MRDFLEMLFVGTVAVGGVLFMVAAAVVMTPWFWLAVIAYILATHL